MSQRPDKRGEGSSSSGSSRERKDAAGSAGRRGGSAAAGRSGQEGLFSSAGFAARQTASTAATEAAGPTGRRGGSRAAGRSGQDEPFSTALANKMGLSSAGIADQRDPFSAAGSTGRRGDSRTAGRFNQDDPFSAGIADQRVPFSAAGSTGRREGSQTAGRFNQDDPFSAGITDQRDPFSAAGSTGRRGDSRAAGRSDQDDLFSAAFADQKDPFSAAASTGRRGGSAVAEPFRGKRSSPSRQRSAAADPASMQRSQGASQAPPHKSAKSEPEPPELLRSLDFLETDQEVFLQNMRSNLVGFRRTPRPTKDPTQRRLYETYAGVLRGSDMVLSIGTEFHLERPESLTNAPAFKNYIGKQYNKCRGDDGYPRMKVDYHPWGEGDWRWRVEEPRPAENPPCWLVQINGPRVFLRDPDKGTLWRGAYQDIWKYLNEKFTVHDPLQRHVHFRFTQPRRAHNGMFDFAQVKCIAQAVLYFDPAFRQLLTPNFHRTSNFSGTDWRTLAERIENARDWGELVSLMHPRLDHVPRPDAPFARFVELDGHLTWNFTTLQDSRENAVEFRNPGPCLQLPEILGWAELGLSFIHAAIQGTSADSLSRFANDIEGLWAFMTKYFIPGMQEPLRMAPLFRKARERSRQRARRRHGDGAKEENPSS